MTDFAEWLVGLVKDIVLAMWDFLLDVAINVFDLFLSALVGVFEVIVVPCFMQSGSALALAWAFNHIPGYVWYFAGHLDLSGCFQILACAVTFRLARKFATLFQW